MSIKKELPGVENRDGTNKGAKIEAARARQSGTTSALWLVAIGLVYTFPFTPVHAQIKSNETATLRSEIASIIESGPPAVLASIRSKSTQHQFASGIADLSRGRKAKTTNVWRIASVTKLVTAAIVLRLSQEGKLELNDPLSKYMPGIVELADSITVRQLMNHTSGIPDYLVAPKLPFNVSANELQANLLRERSIDQLLNDAREQPRQFKPGMQHAYSNTNYLLLGMIIESVTGKTFQAVVQEKIVAGLQLKRTGFADPAGKVPYRRLNGYVPGDTKAGPFKNRRALIDVTKHDYFLGSDGGLYSTLDETAQMLRYILQGPFLSYSTRQQMLDRMVSDHDGFYRYGLGVMTFVLPCGLSVYGHEGRDLGIYTVALFDPAHDRSFVLAANMSFEQEWGIQERIDGLRNNVFCRPHAKCRKNHRR